MCNQYKDVDVPIKMQGYYTRGNLKIGNGTWIGIHACVIGNVEVGKTVIGTAVDGTPEIIRDGIDGYLVEPRNPMQLAEKMNELIENSEMRESMGIQAVKRYQDEFSFEKLSERYVAFYEDL